ncbi:SdpI family protein [Alteribacter populi]|uniref:SdpI family protein n=1 Tax=Alteribacter populi TaxID=2011011 RepID=UPI000BBAE710|nr:SdpI family protein [Alteribacter populi]
MFANSFLGTIILIAGLVLFTFPPKKINSFYGYRTGQSMDNLRSWTFANKLSSRLLILSGAILILVETVTGNFIVTLVLSFVFLILIFILVERKLKRMNE